MSWLKDILDENRRVVNSWPAWKKGAVMTRKEELEKKVKEVFQCEAFGDNVGKSDVLELLIEVEREVLEKVIASVKTQIDIYDSQVEGCDGDEFILYNSMIAELSKFIRWLRTQQQELI